MTKKQKYTALKDGNVTTYFLNGVKRFEHYKNTNGYEWWSDDHPDNPKNKTTEVTLEEIKPFTFGP